MIQYKTYIGMVILSAVASCLLTPLVRWLAVRWGAVDMPGERKIHRVPMPRLGGLAVFAGFSFPWGLLYLIDNRVTENFQNYEKLFLLIMLGGLAMLLLGVYDDLKGANAVKKFMVQILVAVVLYVGGIQVQVLSIPFGPAITLGWFSLPITILWIVGITNAINLLDGIDGLATGVTVCIATALAIINVLANNNFVALLTLCLAGSCLGFLPNNFPPAKIFLGDTGSLFVGIILACVGIISFFKAATAAFVAVPLVLFGLPLFDTASVIVGRAARGVHIFQADQSHVHHRLLRRGLNHKQTAYILYGITLVLGTAAVLLNLRQVSRLITVVFGLVILVIAPVIAWLWLKKK